MTDTRGPNYRPGGTGMSTWGWAALAIAVVVVLGLIFMWSDTGMQQAGTDTTPSSPPASSGSPPAKSPSTTPPASPAPAK